MNVSSRTVSDWPRTSRVKPGMIPMVMAMIALRMFGPSTATMAITSTRPGKLMIPSITRIRTASNLPPR